MSYTKHHAEENAMRHVFDDMQALERRYERETLERLAWEARAALDAYFAALTVYEQHRNEDAGRRADAEIEAGRLPI